MRFLPIKSGTLLRFCVAEIPQPKSADPQLIPVARPNFDDVVDRVHNLFRHQFCIVVAVPIIARIIKSVHVSGRAA